MNQRLQIILETIKDLLQEGNVAVGKDAHKVRVKKGKEKKAGKRVTGVKPRAKKEPKETMRTPVDSVPLTKTKGVLSVASAIAQGENPANVADLSSFSSHDVSKVKEAVKEFGSLHGTNPGTEWVKKYFPHVR